MEEHTHFLLHSLKTNGQLYEFYKPFLIEFTPLGTLRNATNINKCISEICNSNEETLSINIIHIKKLIEYAARQLLLLKQESKINVEARWEYTDWTLFLEILNNSLNSLQELACSKYNALLIIRRKY